MESARTKSAPTEDTGAGAEPVAPKRSNGDDRVAEKENRSVALKEFIRQHPVAAAAVAVGAGMLLQAVVKSLAQRSATRPEKAPPKAPPSRPSPMPASGRRTHEFGMADMKFATHHPDGKNVRFKFAWKKRPTDAPEADWPTDEMGFTSDRPNGKHTEFTLKSKTRPIPDKASAVGENRPGLGQAAMEFTSSVPGRRDFRFTWNRAPAAGGDPQSSANSPNPQGGSAAANAVNRREKRPAKKTSKKKAAKQKTFKKKSSKKKTAKKKASKSSVSR